MRYFIQSFKFFLYKRILGRKFLTATDTIFNLDFHIEIHDAMGRKIFKRGSLHPDHTSFLLTLPFVDGDVILDIGANIGWYSLVLRNNIQRNVTFFAFEPEPLNFELLKKNIAHNHITNIEAVNKAVAEKSGQSTLFLYHPKNSGRHSLLDINPQTNKSIQVETVNIEDFLNGRGIDFKRIKLIKIDIEGYEVFALKNASTLLQSIALHVHRILACFNPSRRARSSTFYPLAFRFWIQFLQHRWRKTFDTISRIPYRARIYRESLPD